MTSKSNFYDQVLGRVADDYEAPHTIAGDLSRDLGREVTEFEVLEALMALAESEQVQLFRYDASSQRYVEVAFRDVESPGSLWFFARK